MTNLKNFGFPTEDVTHAIRVVVDDDNSPWWVASDVCSALGLSDTSMAIARLDEDEKGTSSVGTLGGDQEMLTVNESGLYSLILTSRKPEAKRFKKWVTSEVLPSIRKTGAYLPGSGEMLTELRQLIASAKATPVAPLRDLSWQPIRDFVRRCWPSVTQDQLRRIVDRTATHAGLRGIDLRKGGSSDGAALHIESGDLHLVAEMTIVELMDAMEKHFRRNGKTLFAEGGAQ